MMSSVVDVFFDEVAREKGIHDLSIPQHKLIEAYIIYVDNQRYSFDDGYNNRLYEELDKAGIPFHVTNNYKGCETTIIELLCDMSDGVNEKFIKYHNNLTKGLK